MPVISLVGRQNVGKSTLFNRLSKSRQALVSDLEGLTRDRQYKEVLFDDDSATFVTIIDTGGLTNQGNIIDNGIQSQVFSALEESDVIYFIVNIRDGVIGLDREIASQLRKLQKKILLVCNKAEGMEKEDGAEFYELGLGEPILISAEHVQGLSELVDYTLPLLPKKEGEEVKKETIEGIAVSILGRPNVGKSTLVNRILGEERLLTIDLPGTTRDSIYIPFEHEGQKYTLIDTAGIPRKCATHEKIEIFSILKAREAVEASHVVVLLLDAHEGVTEQDATLLGMSSDNGRALLIVINKWDGLKNYQKQEIKRKLNLKLSFVNYASVHYISALYGSGVGKLFAPIITAYTNAGAKFSTAVLNKILESANQAHQSPLVKGRRLKIKYVNQTDVFPPTLTFHGNHLQNIPNAYDRYLKNFFIDALKLTNTPIHIKYKSGNNPFKDKKNILNTRQIAKKRRLMKFFKKK